MVKIFEAIPYLALFGWLIYSVRYILSVTDLSKIKNRTLIKFLENLKALLRVQKNESSENKYILEMIPQIFTTIGICGTFIGIAIGLYFFDVNNIEKSIPALLDGLKTAFIASIFGIVSYLIFSKWIAHLQYIKDCEKITIEEIVETNFKSLSNTFKDSIGQLIASNEKSNEQLLNVFQPLLYQSVDAELKQISLVEELKNQGQRQISLVVEELKNHSQSQLTALNNIHDIVKKGNGINQTGLTNIKNELNSLLTTTDDNNNQIKLANITKSLFDEAEKQTQSFQAFSTGLADTISAGFEKIINDEEKGVLRELKHVKDGINSLGNNLKDPATKMTESVVGDLQIAMGEMLKEFKKDVSGSTKDEMKQLASVLSSAGEALKSFPKTLANMTSELSSKFEILQDTVSNISQNTLQQSNQSIEVMKQQIEEMSSIMQQQVGGLQAGQANLIKTQSENQEVSNLLLETFNSSIKEMNAITQQTIASMNYYSNINEELKNTTIQLSSISSNVNQSSELFKSAQKQFSEQNNDFLNGNQNTILRIQETLESAKKLSEDYATKFTIIESGLQSIFGQIKNGLVDYDSTIKTSVEGYLKNYSEALTNTVNGLNNASALNREIVEELTEQLANIKK